MTYDEMEDFWTECYRANIRSGMDAEEASHCADMALCEKMKGN